MFKSDVLMDLISHKNTWFNYEMQNYRTNVFDISNLSLLPLKIEFVSQKKLVRIFFPSHNVGLLPI